MGKIIFYAIVTCLICSSVYSKDGIPQTLIPLDTEDPGIFKNVSESSDLNSEEKIEVKKIEISASLSPVFEEQKKIVESLIDSNYQTVNLLKTVTDLGLCVTPDTISEFQKNPKSAIVRMSLKDSTNLMCIMHKVFEQITISSNKNYVAALDASNGNTEAISVFNDIKSILQKLSTGGFLNYLDSRIRESISELLTLLPKLSILMKNNNPKKKTDFTDFIDSCTSLLQMHWAKDETARLFSKVRIAREGIQGTYGNDAVSISFNISTPIPGITVNLEAFINNAGFGSTGTSFYTITKTKGIKGGITFSIPLAKISTKASLEKAEQELHYSLESFIDYCNNSKSLVNKTRFKDLSDVNDKRKDLQTREKDAISKCSIFTDFAQRIGVLPADVNVRPITITRAKSMDKAKELTVAAEASATAGVSSLSSIGINVRTAKTKKIYSKDLPILMYVNSDLSLVSEITINELVKKIGQKFNFVNVNHTFKSIHKDLTAYIMVLENLTGDNIPASKKRMFEKEKHSIEGRWIPHKTIGSHGRAGMLKSMLLTSVILAKDASADDIIICKSIYEKLLHLATLQEFSKNTKGIRKAFKYGTKSDVTNKVKADILTHQASFFVEIPFVGNVTVLAIRRSVNGSPFKEENGEYIQLKFSLPIASTGIIGMAVMRQFFGNILVKAGNAGYKGDILDSLKMITARTAGEVGGKLLTKVSSPVGISISGSSDIQFVWKRLDAKKDYTYVIPLPGMSLIERKNNCWNFDWVAVFNSLNVGANMKSSLPISLKVSTSTGKLAKRTGSNTIHDMFSKMNALLLGIVDRDDLEDNYVNSSDKELTAIKSLCNGQSGQLIKIFRNITKENSNAAYELQCYYNDVMKTIENAKEKEAFQKVVEKFIDSCKKLAIKEIEDTKDPAIANTGINEMEAIVADGDEVDAYKIDAFKETLTTFISLARMNFDYGFKRTYDKAYAVYERQ